MPEEYEIDEAQQMVWSRCWGVLSDEDLRLHRQRLRADPRFRPSMRQLVDTTAATEVKVTREEMVELGRSEVFSPSSKRAYVVSKDVLFGLVRMYEIYQSLRGGKSVKVFRNRPEALAWLGVHEPESGKK